MTTSLRISQTANDLEILFTKLGFRKFNRSLVCNQKVYYGYSLIFLSISVLAVFIYAAFISKLMPPSDNAYLNAIQNDSYFCFLIPLVVLPTYVVIYLNWLSMRFFEHN